MNILYLSHLSGEPFAGPTYSVPKQIEAQSKIDNVFWYNAVGESPKEWKQFPFYHDKIDFPKERISCLPYPFNKPDLIVVELFYNIVKSPLIFELLKGKTPYIIIPRGELTKQAQARKRLKKTVANIFVCKRYTKKAVAIQYLTRQEYLDSGDSWNNHQIIIPNGIDLPEKKKLEFSKESIKCISIGRIEPYQKGLDMLIDACIEIKNELKRVNCTVTIYGPDKEEKLQSLKDKVKADGLEHIVTFYNGVYGEEKTEILLNSDVFLMTSRFEGHPMALIEALSYGLPAIVTTGSNMRTEIEEYNAGWTADNNVDSLSSCLLTMISEKDLINNKSRQANLLAENYKWQTIATHTHDKYTEIIGNRRI